MCFGHRRDYQEIRFTSTGSGENVHPPPTKAAIKAVLMAVADGMTKAEAGSDRAVRRSAGKASENGESYPAAASTPANLYIAEPGRVAGTPRNRDPTVVAAWGSLAPLPRQGRLRCQVPWAV